MTFYADLQPLDYFGKEHKSVLRAIGWLRGGQPFSTGDVEESLFERLKVLTSRALQIAAIPGIHQCDLCQFDGPGGSRNLLIPGDGVIYAMPELAIHYIAAHWYQPPEEFQRAVLTCPDTDSMEYKRALLANGGRGMFAARG
ncbi:hypothetical protein [Planctellipticum variicoloris]|uniref:DUF7919 family protein n=1 Tax=Planctellipticum variicoloris TaxID=3064265 RepID=UPI002B60970E|nr:hypothetical protein SH412_005177 [Planctomycetaceae bacterium SH412]HTN01487.1 hypothetical protein [Planctomycetaceae bacterium]